MTRREIIEAIRSLPNGVDDLTGGLTDEQLRWRPAPDQWSILEVCCHLRDSAEIEGGRIQRLANEDNPFIEAFDQEELARARNYIGEDPKLVRTALRAYWGGLAYLLEGLGEGEWRRGGTHQETGPTTIALRAQLNAHHAHMHIEQMRAIREKITQPQIDTE